jgi:hypothetical protein
MWTQAITHISTAILKAIVSPLAANAVMALIPTPIFRQPSTLDFFSSIILPRFGAISMRLLTLHPF